MNRIQIWDALQHALVCLVAFVIGSSVTAFFNDTTAVTGGMWSAISGLLVLQTTTQATGQAGIQRILGSFIGAIVAVLYLVVLPFSPIGLAVTVAITYLVCQLLRIPQHGRIGAITATIIMVLAALNPELSPLTNASLRFVESVIGTVIALIAVLIIPNTSSRPPSVPPAPKQQ